MSQKKSNSRSPMQLRDYQQSLATEVFRAWGENNKRVMLQLPTGGGKTILFGALASEFIARGETVLVLAHREELVVQAADKVGRICSTDPGIIKAGYQPDYTRPLQVASVQSLVNRLSLLETVGLAIADEAHHSTADTYRKILEAYPDAYQLGVTATPIRLDGTGFRDLFDVLLTGPTVGELISKGYLSPFRLYADPNPMTTSGVKTISGDYSTSGLAAANDAIELSGNLINSYCQYAFGKRCVVFAVNVEHSIAIASRYNAAGIRAYHLDGTTPEGERREVLERFRRGEIQVLSNCQLFDEGLDIPALEVVQVAKPTKSLTRWLQMVGRSLRPDRDKEYAIILDHTKNWAIHGLPTRMRTWTLDGVEEKEKVKTVRDGFGLVSEEIIIEETTAQLTPIEEDAVAGVFRQLKPSVEDLPLSRAAKPRLDLFGVDGPTDWQEIYELLVREQQTKGYKSGWLYYRLLELKPPLSIWQQYATLKGYKPGWAKYRYYEQQNS